MLVTLANYAYAVILFCDSSIDDLMADVNFNGVLLFICKKCL